MIRIRLLAILALVALAGCTAGAASSFAPAARPAAVAEGAQRRLADTATGMPGDTATGMPGDTATGMPGDTATGMPGAQFACAPPAQTGSASCTLAINIQIAPQSDPHLAAALIPGWHPADLQGAYALPAGSPGGTVAIVDAYDDPAAESDLAVYRAAFGLPPCTSANGCFRKVNQAGVAGSYPAPSPGWAREIALDLDMVSAACPRCSIVLVEASSALIDDLGASVDTAARLGATVVSNSYYAPEWAAETAEDVHYRHPGVAQTVSAGDRGTSSYPAASPYVTAVGGTTLTGSGGAWSETAWTYGGRGCSPYEPKPAWQAIAPCATRSAVDVAAVADPAHGVATFDTASGGWQVAGGTSAGAPIVAAAYALSGQPAGPAYSYAHRNAFRVLGNGPYALATGLGSPLGVAGL